MDVATLSVLTYPTKQKSTCERDQPVMIFLVVNIIA